MRQGYSFAISAVTKYGMDSGAAPNKSTFWDKVLQTIIVLLPEEVSVDTAVKLNCALEKKRKQIYLTDFFIEVTAVAHKFRLVTLNGKHFDRIDTQMLID